MKLKHVVWILAVLALVSVVFTSCRPRAAAPMREITLVNNKVEIDQALRDFAAVYERQTGVRVNIRSFGGETPYAPSLAAMFATGHEPEIFVFEGRAGYEDARRAGRLTDLSNEPWVNDTSLGFIDTQGRIVGFPVAIEGWGLGYNRELLQRAGIDPATLNNFYAIRSAFERIDGMRAQLGIDAVVSMAAGPGMTWVTGLHGVNAYLALGLPYNDSTRYIDMLNRGEVDRTRLMYFAEYYNMLFRFSNRATLLTGGYDQQLGDFANGRTVFIHQGNWIDPTFEEWGVVFPQGLGYVPHAFLPEPVNGIFIGAPSWYIVNARASAQGIQDAKDFLNFMASSPEGHDYMVNRAGMVPAFYSVTLQPQGPFSRAVMEWASQGRMYSWQQNEMPDGFGMGTLGPIFHQLASGDINTARFVDLFAAAVATIR